MFDTVRFVLTERDLNNKMSFIEEIPCLINVCKISENYVFGHLKNMRIEIRGSKLYVEGSLTKWLLGNNYIRSIGIREIKRAIASLSKCLNVPLEEATLTRIDVALNFRMNDPSSVYLGKLMYLASYHRSNIKKESLYFTKYNSVACFYDKIAEIKKDDGNNEFVRLNKQVLRYEFRILKVKQFLKCDVKGKDLLDSRFCCRLLDEWYNTYLKIDKKKDTYSKKIKFSGKKEFQLSCVHFCCQEFDVKSLLDEAFIKKSITSIEKFGIKSVIDKADQTFSSIEEVSSTIDELTKKIASGYEHMKRLFRIQRT